MMIVFEGKDGCGKTTQLRKTAEWLRLAGQRVTVTSDINGTSVAGMLAGYALHPEYNITKKLLGGRGPLSPMVQALLLTAARLDVQEQIVLPAKTHIRHDLLEGDGDYRGPIVEHFVLVDRWFLGTMAYQGTCHNCSTHATLVHESGPASMFKLNQIAGVREPDLHVLYDVPEAVCEARRAARGAATGPELDQTMMDNANGYYRELARTGGRDMLGNHLVTLKGDRSVDETQLATRTALITYLSMQSDGRLANLLCQHSVDGLPDDTIGLRLEKVEKLGPSDSHFDDTCAPPEYVAGREDDDGVEAGS